MNSLVKNNTFQLTPDEIFVSHQRKINSDYDFYVLTDLIKLIFRGSTDGSSYVFTFNSINRYSVEDVGTNLWADELLNNIYFNIVSVSYSGGLGVLSATEFTGLIEQSYVMTFNIYGNRSVLGDTYPVDFLSFGNNNFGGFFPPQPFTTITLPITSTLSFSFSLVETASRQMLDFIWNN